MWYWFAIVVPENDVFAGREKESMKQCGTGVKEHVFLQCLTTGVVKKIYNLCGIVKKTYNMCPSEFCLLVFRKVVLALFSTVLLSFFWLILPSMGWLV